MARHLPHGAPGPVGFLPPRLHWAQGNGAAEPQALVPTGLDRLLSIQARFLTGRSGRVHSEAVRDTYPAAAHRSDHTAVLSTWTS